MGVGMIFRARCLIAFFLAAGACGSGYTMRDWGLHRQWTVARNMDHPERPATLTEVPWGWTPVVVGAHPADCGAGGPTGPRTTLLTPPEVRVGMYVTVRGWNEKAEFALRGTALGTARLGETVAVRAGLGGARLTGIVRGPGLVEVTMRKEGD